MPRPATGGTHAAIGHPALVVFWLAWLLLLAGGASPAPTGVGDPMVWANTWAW